MHCPLTIANMKADFWGYGGLTGVEGANFLEKIFFALDNEGWKTKNFVIYHSLNTGNCKL